MQCLHRSDRRRHLASSSTRLFTLNEDAGPAAPPRVSHQAQRYARARTRTPPAGSNASHHQHSHAEPALRTRAPGLVSLDQPTGTPLPEGVNPAVTPTRNRQVCDYEGSAYRTEFWGADRDYEDGAERTAIRHLLPPSGRRLIDIGGGYGRLVPLYRGYDHVIIFDYALSQLREAQRLWTNDREHGSKLTCVAGDFYRLPFAAATFDTAVIVRALHHATDAPAVIRGTAQLLAAEGTLLLEFANKRNLKAILRYLIGRQSWSPFEPEPVEFVPLNFDFHPTWIEDTLRQEGLAIRQRRAVSTFRLAVLKKLVPTRILVALDRLCQPLGNVVALSPSVFLRTERKEGPPFSPPAHLFQCIECGSTDLATGPESVLCRACRRDYPVRDGIYDFRPADEGHSRTASPSWPQHHTPSPGLQGG